MKKNHNYLYYIALLSGLILAFCFSPTQPVTIMAASDIPAKSAAEEAERTDNANSWRYENGNPKVNITTQNLPAIRETTDTAWTKVNGVYVNSKGEPIPNATLKGVDVSYHQGTIDWTQVKAAGIDYAIIRCGYGMDEAGQDDTKWKENADACTALGIPFGTYLYSYADTVERAQSEAQHVLRLIQGYTLSYPVYFDMEDSSTNGLKPTEYAAIAKAFCEPIEAAGYEVAIYANKNWWTNNLTDPFFETKDRWVAQYADTCTYTGIYNMWQCTSSGSVPGISGRADLNFVIGTTSVVQTKAIALNQTALELEAGTTATLTAYTSPLNRTNKGIIWQSSNPAIANVTDGVITALSKGIVNITATAADGSNVSAVCQLTVTDRFPPDAVTNLTYTARSTSSVKLSWDSVFGAHGYTIYRYNEKYKKDIEIKNTTSTSYTIKKLSGSTGNPLKTGTTYRFKVAAYKIVDGKKLYSKKVSLRTTTKPTKATIKSLKKISSTKAKLTWKKNSASTGYAIYLSTKKNSGYKEKKVIRNNKTNTYNLSKLKKGKTYYVKIRYYKKVSNIYTYGAYSKAYKIKM